MVATFSIFQYPGLAFFIKSINLTLSCESDTEKGVPMINQLVQFGSLLVFSF